MSWRRLTVCAMVAANLGLAGCTADNPAPSLSSGDVWIQDITLILPIVRRR